ncbi:MAG: hypothetical protein ACYTEL_23265, partial [Planctomycetota bacterium]
SWENAPVLANFSSGFSGGAYDKTERAYRIVQDSPEAKILSFTMQVFRQGIETSADGQSSLVVWVRTESTSAVEVAIIKPLDFPALADFAAYWLNRCRPSEGYCDGWDFDRDIKVNFADFAIFAPQWRPDEN